MTRQDGPYFDENYLRQGSPTNSTFAESFPRMHVTGNCVIGATGIMTSVALPLQYGDVVTNLTFISGTTAAGTPTNWGFALYSPAGALLAQTADQTTTAWAANTVMTKALATAQLISEPGVYYAALWMKASTQITAAGYVAQNTAVNGAMSLGALVLSQSSGSALVATAPATIASPTTLIGVPYCVAT